MCLSFWVFFYKNWWPSLFIFLGSKCISVSIYDILWKGIVSVSWWFSDSGSMFSESVSTTDCDLVILCLLILIYCLFLWVNIKFSFFEKSEFWGNDKLAFDLPMKSASCLKLKISNLRIVFLVSRSLQNRFFSFTCWLSVPAKNVFILLIPFCTSHILCIRETDSFKVYKSPSPEERDSWSKIEEEVIFLFFISGVWMPFNFFISVMGYQCHLILVVDQVKFDRVIREWHFQYFKRMKILEFFIYQCVLFDKPFNYFFY